MDHDPHHHLQHHLDYHRHHQAYEDAEDSLEQFVNLDGGHEAHSYDLDERVSSGTSRVVATSNLFRSPTTQTLP